MHRRLFRGLRWTVTGLYGDSNNKCGSHDKEGETGQSRATIRGEVVAEYGKRSGFGHAKGGKTQEIVVRSCGKRRATEDDAGISWAGYKHDPRRSRSRRYAGDDNGNDMLSSMTEEGRQDQQDDGLPAPREACEVHAKRTE